MADLYIRWSEASPKDVGDRPIAPCWPPNAIWTNASIWMSYPPNHPDPAKRGQTAYAAQVGESVLITVAAFSRAAAFDFPGLDLHPIRCQVWACNPTNAVGPISALPSSSGPPQLEGLVHGHLEPPDFYGTVDVLWTPQATDGLMFEADGTAHVCLAANLVYAPPTTTAPPLGAPAAQGQFLPWTMANGQTIQTIFPCGDGPVDPRSGAFIGRYHGQKNIRVWNTSTYPTLVLVLFVWALLSVEQVHVLTLTERSGRRAIDPAIREHLLAHDFVELQGGRERRPRVRKVTPALRKLLAPTLGEELLRAGPLPLEPRERARLAGGGRLVLADGKDTPLTLARKPLADAAIEGPTGERGSVLEVKATPGGAERVVVDLGGAREDPPGTVRIFDVAERDADGALIGGTTFVTVAT